MVEKREKGPVLTDQPKLSNHKILINYWPRFLNCKNKKKEKKKKTKTKEKGKQNENKLNDRNKMQREKD